jgi:hypothetical protein
MPRAFALARRLLYLKSVGQDGRRERTRMFKNYLTYTLAQSFHRSCSCLQVPLEMPTTIAKERLLRSAENLVHHFARAVHTKDNKEESMFLAVALICLRDCKESIDEAKLPLQNEIYNQFKLLHGRMEQLCLDSAKSEGGQLRMLG